MAKYGSSYVSITFYSRLIWARSSQRKLYSDINWEASPVDCKEYISIPSGKIFTIRLKSIAVLKHSIPDYRCKLLSRIHFVLCVYGLKIYGAIL